MRKCVKQNVIENPSQANFEGNVLKANNGQVNFILD